MFIQRFHLASSENNASHRRSLFRSAGQPAGPAFPEKDPLRKLLRMLYALTFLFMLLLWLSARMVREERAQQRGVEMVSSHGPGSAPADQSPGPTGSLSP